MTKRMPIEDRKNALDFRSLPKGMRHCGKCREVKDKSMFHKDSTRASGYRSACKSCLNAENKKLQADPNSNYYQYRIRYAEESADVMRRARKRWKEANPDKVLLYESRRRARKAGLPDTLTKEQVERITKMYFNCCAICGDEYEHLDHFIPIATGHGGTTEGNTVPMCAPCNLNKAAKNPVEWSKFLPESKAERLHYVFAHLAKVNGYSRLSEYMEYINDCFKNKK